MKKTLIPFILILSVLFQACTGPRGNDGRPGVDGADGGLIVGQTFEAQGVNFTTANEYSYFRSFADAKLLQVQESDIVLVYILWDVTDSGDPIWRLLPQAIDMPRGITYNFDYTPADFSVFIDAPSSVNLSTLATDWTQNQTLRVVVLPSDFTARKSGEPVDFKDYEAVKKYYNLDETKIPALKAK